MIGEVSTWSRSPWAVSVAWPRSRAPPFARPRTRAPSWPVSRSLTWPIPIPPIIIRVPIPTPTSPSRSWRWPCAVGIVRKTWLTNWVSIGHKRSPTRGGTAIPDTQTRWGGLPTIVNHFCPFYWSWRLGIIPGHSGIIHHFFLARWRDRVRLWDHWRRPRGEGWSWRHARRWPRRRSKGIAFKRILEP